MDDRIKSAWLNFAGRSLIAVAMMTGYVTHQDPAYLIAFVLVCYLPGPNNP